MAAERNSHCNIKVLCWSERNEKSYILENNAPETLFLPFLLGIFVNGYCNLPSLLYFC